MMVNWWQPKQSHTIVEDEKKTSANVVEYLMTMEELNKIAVCKNQDELTMVVLLLIDSGAFDHVCPKYFAEYAGLLPRLRDDCLVVAATGQEVKQYGTRVVGMRTLDNCIAEITFSVMNVTRPILSVSRLCQKGYSLQFAGKKAWLVKRGRALALLQCNGLYFLPVRLLGPSGTGGK